MGAVIITKAKIMEGIGVIANHRDATPHLTTVTKQMIPTLTLSVIVMMTPSIHTIRSQIHREVIIDRDDFTLIIMTAGAADVSREVNIPGMMVIAQEKGTCIGMVGNMKGIEIDAVVAVVARGMAMCTAAPGMGIGIEHVEKTIM